MKASTQIGQSILKAKVSPLNGVPKVSANCWKSILAAVTERSQGEIPVRYLEWGAGNSTVSILKHSLEQHLPVELTSVEHATPFFPYLTGSLIDVLVEQGTGFAMEWRPLKGPHLNISEVGRVLRERRDRESHLLFWEVLSGNKRIQFVDSYEPDFRFAPIRMAKQLVKMALVETTFWWWCIKGLLRRMAVKNPKLNSGVVDRYSFGEARSFNGVLNGRSKEFFDWFLKNPEPGQLLLKSKSTELRIWHLPELRSCMWDRGLLFDGRWTQLPDYVSVPLDGHFDVIFVDGRARVSVVKRVSDDDLVAPGGFLFVHDAFRTELTEGFSRMGSTFSYIDGSNVTIGETLRVRKNFGPPLVRSGDSLNNFNWRISQEMFVFQRDEADEN